MDISKLIKAFTYSGSDKSTLHHYEIAYSQILPDNVENFLEVGIANYTSDKSSVHAWHSLYPNAQIYAIDIVPEKMINNKFTKSFVVDQSNKEQLVNFKNQIGAVLNVIVDDGSHMFDHAKLTYEVLKDCLVDDGVYIIEDIQKNRKFNYQTVNDWVNYLESNSINYRIFDCKPYLDDDSVVICINK
jgi:hypothetical protein